MSVRVPQAWVTWSLVAVLASVFGLQQLAGDRMAVLALQPATFQPWQLASYALLHASLAHLVANGACLAYFGPRVEFALGPGRFVVLLAGCAIAGAACQLAAGPTAIPTVGASAAVYGLLVAGWRLWPRDAALRTTAAAYAGLALLAAMTGPAGGSDAAWAHIGGLGAGSAAASWLRPRKCPTGARSTA